MTEALTTLQFCGFDPLPNGFTRSCQEEPVTVDQRSSILQLLQHQACMQRVILQQFHQIHTLKAMITQIIGEQQRQNSCIHNLESMLHRDKTKSPKDVPVTPVTINESTPKSPEAPRVPFRHPKAVPASARFNDEPNHESGGTINSGHGLREAQQRDPAIQRVVDLKLDGPKRMSRSKMAHEPKVVQQLLQVWDNLEVKGGLLFYRTGGAKVKYVTVLPHGMRYDIFRSLHHSMETLSYGQVLKLMQQKFFWPKLHNETMAYMRQHRKQSKQMSTPAIPPPEEFRD